MKKLEDASVVLLHTVVKICGYLPSTSLVLLRQVRGKDGRRSDGLARSVSLDSNRPPPSDNPYTDVPGTPLEPFFIETLGRSCQDRTFLLQLEQSLTEFVDSGR